MSVSSQHGRHARPKPRQSTPFRLVLLTIAVPVVLALLVVFGELGRHGWASFIFREAGTGATAATQADLNLPSPPPPQPIIVLVMPQLAHQKTMHVTIMVWKGEHLLIVPKWPYP
jgi:hypothetical protein